jgi:hypothetical protein
MLVGSLVHLMVYHLVASMGCMMADSTDSILVV